MREMASLESALARPYATFDLQDLYPTSAHKAAAIFESVAINHPFVDGNKRMAFILMKLFLLENGQTLSATTDETYNQIIRVASGDNDFDQILGWIQAHLKQSAP